MLLPQNYCIHCGAGNQAQASYCFACGKLLQTSPITQAKSSVGTGLLPQNTILNQRYIIIDELGAGGFGAVYKAVDKKFPKRHFAIKEMKQSKLSTQELTEAIRAFEQEAQLLAGLFHPNLPRIYDHFKESGRWYLVMDCIDGKTVEKYLEERRQFTLDEVIDIGIQLCSVLDHLHRQQPPIIFRDLKPANIMLTSSGQLYLIDFGIARHFKPGQTKDTNPIGSPGYAPPEQYGRTQTTSQSDIYSLGAVLHQLITNNDPSLMPFQFDPLPLTLNGHSLPTDLEPLIFKMLDMKPQNRPLSVKDIKAKLQHIEAQLKASSSVSPPSIISPTPPSPPIVVQQPAIAVSNSVSVQIQKGMLVCSFCGTQNPIGTTFCSNCGLSLPVPAPNVGNPHQPVNNPPIQSPPGGQNPGNPNGGKQPGGKRKQPRMTRKQFLVGAGAIGLGLAGLGIYEGRSHLPFFSINRNTSSPYFYPEHKAIVEAITWMPDMKRIASGSKDGVVHIWDVPSGYTEFSLNSGYDIAFTLIVAKDQKYLSMIGEGSLWVYDIKSSAIHFEGVTEVPCFSFSPDGMHCVLGINGLTVVNIESKAMLYEVPNTETHATFWSPSGRYVFVNDHILNIINGALVSIPALDSPVLWSPNEEYVAIMSEYNRGYYTSVNVYSTSTGTLLYSHPQQLTVTAFAWSPDGRYLVTGGLFNDMSNEKIEGWEALTGKRLFIFDNEEPINYIFWSPDGKYITTIDSLISPPDNKNYIVDIKNISTEHVIYNDVIKNWVGWSIEGRYIAIIDVNGIVHVKEMQSGKEAFRSKPNVTVAQWSQDGKYLAMGVGTTVEVWTAR